VNAQFAAMSKIGFPGMNFSTVSDLWGPQVDNVTIRDLLHMESGIPDFDTASPSGHGKPMDPFRATVYAHPAHDFAEPELLSFSWVATKGLNITPGSSFQYSSTNFGLLGLILSQKAGVADYRDFNQSTFIPDDFSHVTKEIAWASVGHRATTELLKALIAPGITGKTPGTAASAWPTSTGSSLAGPHQTSWARRARCQSWVMLCGARRGRCCLRGSKT